MGCEGSKPNDFYFDEKDRFHFNMLGLSKHSIRKCLKVFKRHDPNELGYINLSDLLTDWVQECNFIVLNLLTVIGIHKHLSMNFREVSAFYFVKNLSAIKLIY